MIYRSSYSYVKTMSVKNAGDGLSQQVKDYFQPIVEMSDFSGTILFGNNDKILHTAAYGYENLEKKIKNKVNTVFHVASITKPFTAALILLLRENELLSLQEPIDHWLSDYPNGENLTIHHLLTHTSGIPNYSEFPDYPDMQMKRLRIDETVSWFKDSPPVAKPGEMYVYSNSNYVLLAHIIETVTGVNYRDHLRDTILEPLGLRNTDNHDTEEYVEHRSIGYLPTPNGLSKAPYYDMSIKLGSGSLYSTVNDLHKFNQALHSDELLSGESRRLMFTPHTSNIGYGWFIDCLFGRRVARTNGAAPGSMAHLVRFMDDGSTVIYCSNVRTGLGFQLHRDLSGLLLGEKIVAPKKKMEVQVDKNILESWTGEYTSSDLTITVVLIDGYLWFRYGSYPMHMYLMPLSNDLFFSRDRYEHFRFENNESGHKYLIIDEVTLKQNTSHLDNKSSNNV